MTGVPGVNLLSLAMSVIGTQTVDYRKSNGRTQNALKQFISNFGEPFKAVASVQAATQSVYRQFNLDFQKNYIVVYISLDVLDISRDEPGDQIVWNERTYQFCARNNWSIQDGWCRALAVEIGPRAFSVTP